MNSGHIIKILIVIFLITIGIWVDISGLLDAGEILVIAREYSQHWWLIVVLILLQSVLFTFALAGSLFLWIVAPIYPPPMAAFILASGGTLGGLGAYLFSTYLVDNWILKIENSHTYKLLHKQDNFFTLFAMRIFPAFPHSLINYSSGILRVNLSHFLLAAMLGISIKSYIYARVIYGASSALSLDALLDLSILWPLVLLSAMALVGVYVKYRLSRNPG